MCDTFQETANETERNETNRFSNDCQMQLEYVHRRETERDESSVLPYVLVHRLHIPMIHENSNTSGSYLYKFK